MDMSLYMRVRGRVLGPYDTDKLQSLARRGQLSRMHELSSDGVTWVRASTFPELFTGAQSDLPELTELKTANSGSGSAAGPSADYHLLPPDAAQPASTIGSAKWYYTISGQKQGPVDFSDLQILAGLGQLSPLDHVWTDGMATWTPASQIHGLIKAERQQDAAAATSSGSTTQVPEMLSRAARDSRGWVTFLALAMYLYGTANVALGILTLVVGARERSAPAVAEGIFFLVHALVVIIGGWLLSTYAGWLGKLKYTQDVAVLQRSLESLRNFWIFVSMYTIVTLTFIVIGAIAVFAYGMTFPHFGS